jgi:hypothetical protein
MLWNLHEPLVSAAPAAQSVEGRKVEEAAERAIRHWHDRAEFILAMESSTDAFSYNPLPLEPALSVRVKYRYVGKLKPLAYPLDE